LDSEGEFFVSVAPIVVGRGELELPSCGNQRGSGREFLGKIVVLTIVIQGSEEIRSGGSKTYPTHLHHAAEIVCEAGAFGDLQIFLDIMCASSQRHTADTISIGQAEAHVLGTERSKTASPRVEAGNGGMIHQTSHQCQSSISSLERKEDGERTQILVGQEKAVGQGSRGPPGNGCGGVREGRDAPSPSCNIGPSHPFSNDIDRHSKESTDLLLRPRSTARSHEEQESGAKSRQVEQGLSRLTVHLQDLTLLGRSSSVSHWGRIQAKLLMFHVSSRTRRFLSRHLFLYLGVLALVVTAVAVVIARQPLAQAWSSFDRRLLIPVLLLSLLNYSLRYLKWDFLLRRLGEKVPASLNLRIYFSCLTMVVTPFRLGEFYKLVFLRRLHAVPLQRSGASLFAERLTDAIALLALASLGFTSSQTNFLPKLLVLLLAALLTGAFLSRPKVQKLALEFLQRFRFTRPKAQAWTGALASGARLFSLGTFLPALGLSVVAWFAECVGLYLILVGLGNPINLEQAIWIYAAATIAGNLTFLPGGLIGTEAVLLGMLRQLGVDLPTATAATLLIRGATLWFAVVLGLVVSLSSRKTLDWDEVAREATLYS